MADTPTPVPNINVPTGQGPQHLAALQSYAAAELQRQAVEAAAPVKYMSDMLAQLLGHKSAEQMQMAQDLATKTTGHLLPMLAAQAAEAMGLSPLSMVTATQNAFAQGGMKLRSSDGTFMPMIGYGPMADSLAGQAWKQIDQHFTHPGGALNLATTYGANRDDIAQTLQEMQRRGIFAGQPAGSVETLTDARLGQLRTQAAVSGDRGALEDLKGLSAGDPFATVNPALTSKMTSWGQETLKGIADLRAVLGNLPVSQILSEMERLSGVNISVPGGVSQAMGIVHSRMANGQALGMSGQGALEFAAATNSTLDQLLSFRNNSPAGSFYNASAMMGGAVDEIAGAAYLEHRAGGGRRQLGEIAARVSSDMAQLVTESPELVEATYALGMFTPGSDPHNALLRSVQAFGEAGTVQQRSEANLNMANVFTEQTGIRSGALIGNVGLSDILDNMASYNPDDLRTMSQTLMRTNQATQIGDWRQIMGQLDSNSPIVQGLGGYDRAAEFAQAIYQTIPAQDRNAINASIQQGGVGAAQSQLQGRELPGFGDAFQMFTLANEHMLRAGGGGMGDFLSYTTDQANLRNSLGGNVTGEGRSQYQDERKSYEQAAIEGRGFRPLSAGQQAEQGFFGGTVPLEDKLLLIYGKHNDDPNDMGFLKFNKDGGAEVSKDQVGQIRGLWDKLGGGKGDIGRALGLKGDASDEEIAKALGTSEGFNTLTKMLGSKDKAILGFGENASGERGIDFVPDPEKLREGHDKERNKAAVDADKAAGAAASASKPIQVHLDLGGTIRTLLGSIFGLG